MSEIETADSRKAAQRAAVRPAISPGLNKAGRSERGQ
jgi:hypothetical protein